MNKVLRFALLATIILPLVMVSCKPKNNPDNPTNPENPTNPTDPTEPVKNDKELFDEWTTIVDSIQQPINLNNILGIWRWEYGVNVEKNDTSKRSIFYELNKYSMDSLFYEIKSDKTFIQHYYYGVSEGNGENYTKADLYSGRKGTWELQANKYLEFYYKKSGTIETYEIYMLEKNRMTIMQQFTEGGVDMIRYEGYSRVGSVAPQPENPTERLTKYEWRITSDTLKISINQCTTKGDETICEQVSTSEPKVNFIPANCTLKFKEDGNLTLSDEKGNVIGQYTWEDRQMGAEADPTYRTLEITYVSGQLYENSRPLIPNYFQFYPDLKDPNKAVFFGQDSFLNTKHENELWEISVLVEQAK